MLDIIDVPLLSHDPKSYQSENWLLDPDHYWKRVGRMAWADIAALSDNPPALWLNDSSTGSGAHDRVALAAAQGLTASLYLLRLGSLELRVFAPSVDFGDPRRRVQAGFVHHGVNYRLWVTDPYVEKKYLGGPDGTYGVGECFATISLGEPYKGHCYKLVAALITPDLAAGENG